MAPPPPMGFLAPPAPSQRPVPPAQPLLGLRSCFPADTPFRHAERATQLWHFCFLFCPKSRSDAALPLGLQDVGPLPLLCRIFRRTLLALASPPQQGAPHPQGCLALSPAGAGRTPLGGRLKAAGAHGNPPCSLEDSASFHPGRVGLGGVPHSPGSPDQLQNSRKM